MPFNTMALFKLKLKKIIIDLLRNALKSTIIVLILKQSRIPCVIIGHMNKIIRYNQCNVTFDFHIS